MNAPTLLESHRLFEGWQKRYQHHSSTLNCTLNFSIYLPPQTASGTTVPALYWLSGLTCTDENFSLKAGAQRMAAELGIALVIPDTSPRGEGVPDAPDGAYDLGLGAGFYLNATEPPWNRHYRMYDYILEELPALVEHFFPIQPVRAISGHSMGGHGALVIGLRNPERYRSISAFAPIAHPTACPWGRKAFSNYLGNNQESWQLWDACHLIEASHPPHRPPLRVDQGAADDFLAEQLNTDRLVSACKRAAYPAEIHLREGYDHSYFFISTFIEAHLRFHAGHLRD